MFSNEIKKKSKITSGLIIILGIFLMSIVVLVDNSFIIEKINNNIKGYSQSINHMKK